MEAACRSVSDIGNPGGGWPLTGAVFCWRPQGVIIAMINGNWCNTWLVTPPRWHQERSATVDRDGRQQLHVLGILSCMRWCLRMQGTLARKAAANIKSDRNRLNASFEAVAYSPFLAASLWMEALQQIGFPVADEIPRLSTFASFNPLLQIAVVLSNATQKFAKNGAQNVIRSN